MYLPTYIYVVRKVQSHILLILVYSRVTGHSWQILEKRQNKVSRFDDIS